MLFFHNTLKNPIISQFNFLWRHTLGLCCSYLGESHWSTSFSRSRRRSWERGCTIKQLWRYDVFWLLLLLPESFRVCVACKSFGLLLFKPRWDYEIYVRKNEMNSGGSNMAYLVNKWASFEIKFTLSKQKISPCITPSVAYRQMRQEIKWQATVLADQDSLVSTLSEDKKETLNLESRFPDNRLPRDFPSN